MKDSSRQLDLLWLDLEQILQDLGGDGGLTSPSVYDTAQCLRYFPPENPWPAVDWLLSQQHADGGWGIPAAPKTRYVPTLAVLLALSSLPTKRKQTEQAIAAGLAFIRRNEWEDWKNPSDDLPVGVELLLPLLVQQAQEAGLPLKIDPYKGLIPLGDRRREQIRRIPRLAGTPAVGVWEGWGTTPDPAVVDGSGTVGHSSTASAIWLSMARNDPQLHDLCEIVEERLFGALKGTTSNIPGVINSCWPIANFERTFALYPLLVAGFLNLPATHRISTSIQNVINQQVGLLESAMTPNGIGLSDWFLADGDDTAVAVAILSAIGRPVPIDTLMRFRSPQGDHFCAWLGELQPSPSVTAHALHALALSDFDGPLDVYQEYLLKQRLPNGLWSGEKWNISSIYTTSQIIIALIESGLFDIIPSLCQSLLLFQHNDGGWGINGSSAEETSYAVLALLMAKHINLLPQEAYHSLTRAKHWMSKAYRPFELDGVPLWLGKETYRPLRIARAFEVVGLIALLMDSDI